LSGVAAVPLEFVTVTVNAAGNPGCAADRPAPAGDTFAASSVSDPPDFVRVLYPNVTFTVEKTQ
jgi:hypothetical protein